MEKKKCTKCDKIKNSTEFHRCSCNKDGLQSQCKLCKKEYYSKNSESISLRVKQHRKVNKEKISERVKKYYRNNWDKINKRHKKYYRDNWECQICGKTINEVQLHCHHIEGYTQNPILGNDIDNVVTLCKKCHKKVHKLPGCNYYDLRCKSEGNI